MFNRVADFVGTFTDFEEGLFSEDGLTDVDNLEDFFTGFLAVVGLSSLHRPFQATIDFFNPELSDEERAQSLGRFFTGIKFPVDSF